MRPIPVLLAIVVLVGCAQPVATASLRLHEALLWSTSESVGLRFYHARGAEWDEEAVTLFIHEVENVTGKRVLSNVSRELRGADTYFDPSFVWTVEAIDYIRWRNAIESKGTYQVGEVPTLDIVSLNGRSEDGASGSYAGGVVDVRFAWSRSAHPNITLTRAEAGVLIHEFGHAIGLINGSIPMNRVRETTDGRHHSTSPSSVMYSGPPVDVVNLTEAELQAIVDARPLTFDAYDWEDIRAFQALDPSRRGGIQ